MENEQANGAEKRKRGRGPRGPRHLLAILWEALETSRSLLGSEDEATRLKAAHAVSALSLSYRGAWTDTEGEARIRALEEAAQSHVVPFTGKVG